MSFIFGGFPTPEEMKAAAERSQMQAEDFRRGIARLFDELDQDKLTTLVQLFSAISSMPNEHMPQMVSYYEGIMTAKLQDRFNICPGCGENHDELPDDMIHKGHDHSDISEDEVPGGEPVIEANLPRQPHPDSVAPPVEVVHELHPDDLAKMEEYGLEDVRDEDTLKLLHFRCKNCGLFYSSIEDRMLKEPGVKGCDGCQQKAKWG